MKKLILYSFAFFSITAHSQDYLNGLNEYRQYELNKIYQQRQIDNLQEINRNLSNINNNLNQQNRWQPQNTIQPYRYDPSKYQYKSHY